MTAGDLPPTTLRLHGPCRLAGTTRVPGDKSISHRALLLSALATGTSRISGLSSGDDVRRTRECVTALGAAVTDRPDGTVEVAGGRLGEPEEILDHGNSGTGIRLMAGLAAGIDGLVVLTGDEFLRQRPMGRIVGPLREMGVRIDGRDGGSRAPLAVRGGRVRGIRYRSPVASAQVKSAVLLAGLAGDGPTTVVEPTATRRHTEEMLAGFGADVDVAGLEVTVRPGRLRATDVTVPGDPSQAAFWVVGALVSPDGEITVADLYQGPGRGGFVDVLRAMGAAVVVDPTERTLRATAGPLAGIEIDPAAVSSFIDEVPVLAVAAAAATGRTVLSGAEELRVKESDRIRSTVAMLRAFGVDVEERPDGMVIEGGATMRGAVVDSHGDHRIAMAATIAGLRADGETVIHGWESVATSYPGYADYLNELTGGAARAVSEPT